MKATKLKAKTAILVTAFASALGKALRPTAKHSHGSCLSACKTIRSSTHRKISHSDVLPEEGSVAASTAAVTITKHQPNVSMKIAKSCAKDLKIESIECRAILP